MFLAYGCKGISGISIENLENMALHVEDPSRNSIEC